MVVTVNGEESGGPNRMEVWLTCNVAIVLLLVLLFCLVLLLGSRPSQIAAGVGTGGGTAVESVDTVDAELPANRGRTLRAKT